MGPDIHGRVVTGPNIRGLSVPHHVHRLGLYEFCSVMFSWQSAFRICLNGHKYHRPRTLLWRSLDLAKAETHLAFHLLQ